MITNILYLILAFLISIVVAIWLYYSKKRAVVKQSIGLLVLRFLSILALLLLIINPKWERNVLSVHKPQLVVALDNSASIKYVKADEFVQNILTGIKEDKKLNDKFDVNYFSFGNFIQTFDSLDFSESQTNQTQLLKQLNTLYGKTKSPVILITDGNQTFGSSYEYYTSKNPIYPIVVGDTIQHIDISINQLNSNQYAFLDNKFPVEIFTLYKGAKRVSSRLEIYRGKQRIYSKNLTFNKDAKAQKISILLKADKVGQHFYTARLNGIPGEKNRYNNKYDFSVEVVDQQTKVLLISSFYHPDLGAIKKSIEANKQREVSISVGDFKSDNLSDYQLVILYQPTEKLRSVFNEIKISNLNSFIITGTHTDWTFLNAIQNNFSKSITSQFEDFQAVYNPNYNEFVTKDIDFGNLPPLKAKFGSIQFKVPFQSILNQKIGGIETEEPLLVTYTKDKTKNVVLFGAGLWRWRMSSKVENQTDKPFDSFLNTLVQYTANSQQGQQLHLFYDKLAYNNDEYRVKASYVDQNYRPDSKASLLLHLTNKLDKSTKMLPFYLANNEFQVVLPNLNPGDYTFKVTVDKKNSKKTGSFKVLDYTIEQQFTSANKHKLQRLANQTTGILSYADTWEKMIQNLYNDEQFQSIQKSKKITTPLIDWYWLLAFIVVSLSIEWFIRKYKGLI